MRHQFTHAESSKGGRSVARSSGGPCPKCGGKEYPTHAALAGHISLHTWADKYTDGDIVKAQKLFAMTGAAKSDPCPWNGAYEAGHAMLRKFGHEQPPADETCPF